MIGIDLQGARHSFFGACWLRLQLRL